MVTCTSSGIAKGTLDQSVWLLTSNEARREKRSIVSETGSRCNIDWLISVESEV